VNDAQLLLFGFDTDTSLVENNCIAYHQFHHAQLYYSSTISLKQLFSMDVSFTKCFVHKLWSAVIVTL